MSSSVFYSDERSVVEREVETRVRPSRAVGELVDYYELDRCVQFVEAGEFKKVALQFPDDLLADSTSLASILEQKTGAKMYILADTSYGSCCVDKITAQHVNADCLIHFGHVSFIPPGHLPVLCVFGCEPIDCEDCVLKFKSLFPDVTSHVLIMSDVIYYHAQDLVVSRLVDKYSNLVASVIADRELATTKDAKCVDCQCGSKDKDRQDLKQVMEDDEKLPEVNNIWQSLLGRKFGLAVEKSLHDYAVFYIGCEGPVLTNFMMCMNKCQFYSYNPVTHTGRQETVNINRSLKKRYYLIQKAKDAKVVGIIVGTLGVGDYLSVVDRLKSVIKQAGKKCYLFVVGKLNPAKLANFMEIDVFVVVAAAESSLIESQDFYRPILTPYELEIACGCHQWTGDYITDCTQLPDVSHVDIQSQSDGDFEPEFSLITGSLKTTDITDSTVGYVDGNLQAIAKRDPMKVAIMQSTGAQFLSERSWKGLEQRLGDTPASHAVRGRRGVAIAYEDEPQT